MRGLNQRETNQIHVLTIQELSCHHNSTESLLIAHWVLLKLDNHSRMNNTSLEVARNEAEWKEFQKLRFNFSSEPGVRTSSHRVYTIANQYHWWIRYNEYGWMSTLWLVIHLDTSMLSFRIFKDRKWTKLEHIPGAQSDRSINTFTIHPQHSKIHSKQSTASPSHLGLSCRVNPSLPNARPQLLLLILLGHYSNTHTHKDDSLITTGDHKLVFQLQSKH